MIRIGMFGVVRLRRRSLSCRRRQLGASRLSEPPHHADRAVRGRRPDRRDRAHRRRRTCRRRSASRSSSRTSSAPAAPPPRPAPCAPRPTATRSSWAIWARMPPSVALFPNLAYKPDVDFEPIGMAAGTPVLILGKKDFPPKDLKEFVAYREGQRRQAEHGACRRRLGVVHHLPAAQLIFGGQADDRAVQRHRPGDERAGRRPGRLHVRPDRQRGAADQLPAPSRAMRSARPSAIRRCPTCRPPRKPACRSSRPRPGTRCSRPKARPSRSSTSSAPRSTRRSTTRTPASACSISAATFRTSRAGPAGARRAGEERDRALDADHQGGRGTELTRVAADAYGRARLARAPFTASSLDVERA